MGISGLLGLLKSIQRPVDLKKYAGETLGVDAYVWLHRGAISCALELAQGKPTRKYIDFCMHRVRMFKHFGVTPYLVFDGDYLPSKAATEASREKRREESRKAGQELLKAGKPAKAYQEFQKAIDVTPEMARLLIEELKMADIPYVVAPYEADAQLVYLERQGIISGIVSEDSDLLVFGAKRLLTKLEQHGKCIEINRKDFCAVREISLTGWSDKEFRHMAILSGCDYLDGINGVGLKTAYRHIRKHKTPERIVKMLQFGGNTRIPENYLSDFQQAEQTFLYQRVFCPLKQDIVHLTDPDESVDIENMPFIGAPVEAELARSIAVGNVHPITKQPIVLPPSPGKRRISQVFRSLASEKKPVSKPPGKPINAYFSGSRRIPLGEMDPNCFNVESQQNGDVAQAAPRPIVFPLPRPYLDSADSSTTQQRTYISRSSRRQSEPMSNLLESFAPESVPQHRRRTAGPIFQVFQDGESSTRPPKKARLCEDLPTGDSESLGSERSKFFSSNVNKPTKKELHVLMSDDSIDEAFRSLPDVSIGSIRKPSRKVSQDAEAILDIVEDEEILSSDVITKCGDVEAEVEIPASSPLQKFQKEATQKAAGDTPVSRRLQTFSYKSTSCLTKIVHGLPTPSSSMQKPSGTPNQPPTPMLTPLQRIGSQAFNRNNTTSILPTPRRSAAGILQQASGSIPVNPSSIPLPKVDINEVEALNRPCGSEDQIFPNSDGESDAECLASAEEVRREKLSSVRRLDLSKFLYS